MVRPYIFLFFCDESLSLLKKTILSCRNWIGNIKQYMNYSKQLASKSSVWHDCFQMSFRGRRNQSCIHTLARIKCNARWQHTVKNNTTHCFIQRLKHAFARHHCSSSHPNSVNNHIYFRDQCFESNVRKWFSIFALPLAVRDVWLWIKIEGEKSLHDKDVFLCLDIFLSNVSRMRH